ncbi:MAG: hypothetical protein M1834_009279 [Cirrosporium novae-zelandiae]|nr:MAG: hypothetical protein M1834_009279 [Cirrosporium novae-zelandiae]
MDRPGSGYSTPGCAHNTASTTICNTYPYNPSISSSASSSSSSVFSVDIPSSSQSSTSSCSAGPLDVVWENESAGQHQILHSCSSHYSASSCQAISHQENVVPAPLRQNPRRTHCPSIHDSDSRSASLATYPRPPATLVRQNDRKEIFVDSLVDSAAQIVEAIWPLSVVPVRCEATLGGKGVLPLRTFIQETLRRSKTSYSTLQVALYYLILIKPYVPRHNFTMEQPYEGHTYRAMQCGRRMFLSALILASKYLQDRNFSARAWSKISGLPVTEISTNELTFLKAVDWKLHMPEQIFQKWTDIVLTLTPRSISPSPPPSPSAQFYSNAHADFQCLSCPQSWKSIMHLLTPELDLIDINHRGSEIAILKALSDPITLPRPAALLSRNGSPVSNERTPTNKPSLLSLSSAPSKDESMNNRRLPPLPRLPLLPTPQMTPPASSSVTPAASTNSFCSKGSSISAALSQAKNMCMTRTILDQWPHPRTHPIPVDKATFPCRRSSLATSSSSLSSPESMVSDISSRSSRSSSISSVASSSCAPCAPRLAVQAARRFATLQMAGQKDPSKTIARMSSSEEMYCHELSSSPEYYSGSLGRGANMTSCPLAQQASWNRDSVLGAEAVQSEQQRMQLPTYNQSTLPLRCLKRGRQISTDISIHQTVRDLLAEKNEEDGTVLSDNRLADSFLLTPSTVEPPKEIQYPSSRVSPPKLPFPKSMGRKRACCCEEAGIRPFKERLSDAYGVWAGFSR